MKECRNAWLRERRAATKSHRDGRGISCAVQRAVIAAALGVMATSALAHDCRVVGNGYLRGSYEGECQEKDEIAHGRGTAKGADSYVGDFVWGRPEGKGVYRWENGATLDGAFRAGRAQGNGVYVSAKGTRYNGPFEKGKLVGAKPEDCPATPGPLNC